MEKISAKEILEKHRLGTTSDSEKELIKYWLMFGDFPEAARSDIQISGDLLSVSARLPLARRSAKVFKLWRAVVVAAAAVIIVSVGIGLFLYQSNVNIAEQKALALAAIAPGSNKAVLTLADGKQINLSDARSGELAKQAGVKISKTADGRLVYQFTSGASSSLNTVSTPRGGQYVVVLQDGSTVWLNAVSSLKFPTSFAGLKSRSVELIGEGYFEVSKDSTRPFMVSSNGQSVEVLGTHFNINSYLDNGQIMTTLLEGKVKVSLKAGLKSSRVLLPGEQATVNPSVQGLEVEEVDIEESVAWKNGVFMFNNQRLEDILQTVSRWYDVDIEYQDIELKDSHFWATVSRYDKVGKLLELLEKTHQVKFKVEGKKIIVSK